MSQEKVEAVRRLARAFNEGDVDAIVGECDPNVEWEEQPIPGVAPVTTGTRESGVGLKQSWCRS